MGAPPGEFKIIYSTQACAPGGRGGYYVNAFGLLYGEVTASNLLHVSLEGDIIDTGSTQLGVNVEGIGLHSAIHKSRADIKCAIHLHNAATVAVSCAWSHFLFMQSQIVPHGEGGWTGATAEPFLPRFPATQIRGGICELWPLIAFWMAASTYYWGILLSFFGFSTLKIPGTLTKKFQEENTKCTAQISIPGLEC